jgi:hypothetical protein
MLNRTNEEDSDIRPVNGPARFCFLLSQVSPILLPDWPPSGAGKFGWDNALNEIKRHWPIISLKNIWSPYPILSYCVGAAEGPVDISKLSEIERIVMQTLHDYKDDDRKVHVRYFLFPHSNPDSQAQAIAQVICETIPGAPAGHVKIWVDALRENELSGENVADIKNALNQWDKR